MLLFEQQTSGLGRYQNLNQESPVKTRTLSATLMTVGLLIAAPAFAQTTPAQKQPTQEGGGSSLDTECYKPYNASPSADPNCKQRTQNLTPSSGQADFQVTGKQK